MNQTCSVADIGMRFRLLRLSMTSIYALGAHRTPWSILRDTMHHRTHAREGGNAPSAKSCSDMNTIAKVADMSSAIEKLTTSPASKVARVAALRDALLPKLISGELRVEDAEQFIGGRLSNARRAAVHAFVMHGARARDGGRAAHIEEQVKGIERAVVENPGLAFDLAKTVVESACRTILAERKIVVQRRRRPA